MTEYTKQDFVIDLLKALGWTDAGESRTQTFRLITHESYPLPGAEVTTGGRPRFAKGAWRVTVGKVSTYFYRPDWSKEFWQWEGRRVKTKDAAEVERVAKEVAP